MTEEEFENLKKELADAKASIDKLTKKNSELIEREKAAKVAADEAARTAQESQDAAALASGDLAKVRETLEKNHKTAIEAANKRIQELEATNSKFLVDAVISDAIAKNGVLPDLIPMVAAYLKDGVRVEDGAALKDGMPLTDHVQTYFQSESARAVVAAPVNVGAGAQGSTTAATPHNFTKANFLAKAGEWALMKESDPARAASIATELGYGHLND